jgi:malonyl CoA-acyl carrier protein transacylase
MMTVSIACLRTAAESNSAIKPGFVIVHSLGGEYVVSVAANVLEFTDLSALLGSAGA